MSGVDILDNTGVPTGHGWVGTLVVPADGCTTWHRVPSGYNLCGELMPCIACLIW